jgi:predicted RNA-binding protein with PIN domain
MSNPHPTQPDSPSTDLLSMRVLIVDGYNVIRSAPSYHELSPDDFGGGPGWNAARSKLIADVATVAQGLYDATVVFDGGGNPESQGAVTHEAGIAVIYSAAGTDADQEIERLAHEAQEKGREVVVVTSDAATQWTVYKQGVTRMSSAAFFGEVSAANASWRESNPSPIVKTTLAERLDSPTVEVLARWARGNRP